MTRSQGATLWLRYAERGLIAGLVAGTVAGLALTRIRRRKPGRCIACGGTWSTP